MCEIQSELVGICKNEPFSAVHYLASIGPVHVYHDGLQLDVVRVSHPANETHPQGKEFETRLREKKPGDLSEELRRALGMPTGPVSQSANDSLVGVLYREVFSFLISGLNSY